MTRLLRALTLLWPFPLCATEFSALTAPDFPPVAHVGPAPDIDYFAAGQAFADVDGDGRLDLLLTSSSQGNVLLMNGPAGFSARPDAVLAMPESFHAGSLALDVDNDGDPDFLVLSLIGVSLLRNDGAAGLTDITAASGLDAIEIQGENASAGDFDGDGRLDLYLVGWFDTGHPLALDRLLRQEPDGRFSDWSHLLPADRRGRPGFVASFVDIDDDGDVDLYVVNDKQLGNVLWRNDGPGCGGWCFTDISIASGGHRPVFGMGLAIGDYDGDLDLDLYFSSIGEQVMLRNDGSPGEPSFTDVGVETGTAFAAIGWGAEFADFDNDGWLDLYLCTMNGDPALANRLFRNMGNGSFADISAASGSNDAGPSIGLAKADFDNDGRMDLVIGNWRQQYHLYRNQSASSGHWVGLRLQGSGSVNRDAVGARVLLRDTQARVHRRDVITGTGMGGGGDLRLHVGLGDSLPVDAWIRWPDGKVQRITPAVNRYTDVPYAGIPDVLMQDGLEAPAIR